MKPTAPDRNNFQRVCHDTLPWLISVSLGRFLALPVNEGKSIRLEVADGFYLSPIVRADKAAYLEHFSDPEIVQNLLAIPFPYTEADADWWLDRCEQSVGSPMTNFALRARPPPQARHLPRCNHLWTHF